MHGALVNWSALVHHFLQPRQDWTIAIKLYSNDQSEDDRMLQKPALHFALRSYSHRERIEALDQSR